MTKAKALGKARRSLRCTAKVVAMPWSCTKSDDGVEDEHGGVEDPDDGYGVDEAGTDINLYGRNPLKVVHKQPQRLLPS